MKKAALLCSVGFCFLMSTQAFGQTAGVSDSISEVASREEVSVSEEFTNVICVSERVDRGEQAGTGNEGAPGDEIVGQCSVDGSPRSRLRLNDVELELAIIRAMNEKRGNLDAYLASSPALVQTTAAKVVCTGTYWVDTFASGMVQSSDQTRYSCTVEQ